MTMNHAFTIYVMAAGDPVDAIEMVNECNDHATLAHLCLLLQYPSAYAYNNELNELMLGPVLKRLQEIEPSSAVSGA